MTPVRGRRAALAVVLLAIWAALVGVAASRLVHVGTALMAATALAFAAAAASLLLRHLWAQVFALLFLALTGLAFVLGGLVAALWAANPPRYDAFLHGLVTGMLAVLLLGLGAATLAGALGAGRAAVEVGRASSPAVRWASVSAAIVLVASVTWAIGDRYLARQLWNQDSCLAGVAADCYALGRPTAAARTHRRPMRTQPAERPQWVDWNALTDAIFSPEERAGFARLGCSGGHSGACENLAAAIANGPWPAASDEGKASLQVLGKQCGAGDAPVCERLASVLYRAGKAGDADGFLLRGCESKVAFCASSAAVAAPHSVAAERALYERGCDRDDARSCRGLLYHRPPDSAGERSTLQRKLCLIGDVNDCMPLIRNDTRAICPEICAARTELRAQSCSYCAKAAREAGATSLAEAWQEAACAANRSYCAAAGKAKDAGLAISK